MAPNVAKSLENGPVIIVGAGLAGLALAQALRKRGIDYRVFDRDPSVLGRSQGWSVSVHWVIDELVRNLPDDLPSIDTINHLYNVGLKSEGAIFDGKSGAEKTRFRSAGGNRFIRATRPKVREWLSTNLQVQWDKRFERYTEHESGVTVFFSDGSSVEGCMLIGADGAHSRVRQQLLGTVKGALNVMPIDVYVGHTTLNKEQYQRQFNDYAPSLYIAETDDCFQFVGLRSVADDLETAAYYWMVFRHLSKAEVGSKHSIRDWSNEQIYDAARSCVSSLLPKFQEVIQLSKPEGIHRPELYMESFMPPEGGFGSNRVTLLGDAAHKMTPFRGEGGNHAIQDSNDLIKTLDTEYKGVPDLIRRYEALMLPRARKAVRETDASALDWHKETVDADWANDLNRRIKSEAE